MRSCLQAASLLAAPYYLSSGSVLSVRLYGFCAGMMIGCIVLEPLGCNCRSKARRLMASFM